MYVLLVCLDRDWGSSWVHVVDDQGKLAHSGPAISDALRWLWDKGEEQVVAMTDVDPELFLIEPCEGLQMTLPALSLRRAHHGHCCDLPALPGLDPDPGLRARLLDGCAEVPFESRARRARSVRHPTAS